MACHKHGMIDAPKDLVRDGAGVFGRARERVRLLYPEAKEMNRLIVKDSKRFLTALDEAAGPFLKVGIDKDRRSRSSSTSRSAWLPGSICWTIST